MKNTEYKRIEWIVQNLAKARHDFLEISPSGEIPQDTDTASAMMLVKITCFNAISELLKFCQNELEEKRNTTVDQIKKKLCKNFNKYYPSQISFQKIKSLDSVVHDITEYLKQQSSYTAVMFTDEDDYLIKHFVKPKPGDLNIDFVNKKIEPLKKILPILPSVITPENAHDFLKHALYKDLDEFTLTCAIDELKTLLKYSFFDVDVKDNASWMRSIRFLNQLKNIMRETSRKFWDIFYVEKPSVERKPNIASDHVTSQKNESKKIPVQQKQSSMVSSASQASPEDFPQTKRKSMRNAAIVVDPSLMPKENKTIEQYLKEADQDFAVGGFKFLSRAKERYERILKMFPWNGQEEYIRNQIARIDEKLDLIYRPLPQKTVDTKNHKKFPPQGKIDAKTWTIEDDFSHT